MFDVKVLTITIVAVIFLVVLQKTWKERWFEFTSATAISLMWSLYYPYEYVGGNMYVLGINLYPFVLWAAALMAVVLVYDNLNQKNTNYSFMVTAAMYWMLLISAEVVWYWGFGVRLTSHYDGLWGFDVIHGPTTLKAFYLLAGPLFLGTIVTFRENAPTFLLETSKKRR